MRVPVGRALFMITEFCEIAIYSICGKREVYIQYLYIFKLNKILDFSYSFFSGWRPFQGAILLGDSGYGNRSWLITPNVPADLPPRGKEIYLRRHKSTRQVVECSIGMLKAKFPCLRYLRLKSVEQCARVILACITLYNVQTRFQRDREQLKGNLPKIKIFILYFVF